VSVNIVGFRASETIPANTLFRISLADYWYNASSFTFPDAAQKLYQNLFALTRVIPTTPLGAITGDKVAVFDGNLKEQMTGAQLVARMENAGSTWAYVSKLERLTGVARQQSSSEGGMESREEEKEVGQEVADAENVLAKFMHSLGVAGNVAKWVGIGAAAVALLYFGAPIMAALSKKK
jgi:hypothetical protein